MAVWDRWLNSWLDSHGYAKKADVSRSRLVSTLFAGETGGDMYAQFNARDWDEEQLTRFALNCAIVGRDVGALARMGMGIPLQVYAGTEQDREVADGHPFLDVWRHVNDYWDARLLMHYTYWWYYLRGEAYWLLAPDTSGQLAEIWPIPATRIAPIPDARKYIKGYAYTSKTDGKTSILRPEYVAFFRHGPHLFNYHRGMSWISHYHYELESDREMVKWSKESFGKGLTLDAILSVPSEVSEAEFEKAKADLTQTLDTDKRRWILTRAGDVNATVVGLNARDAEYLGSLSMNEHRIDGVYGFPDGFWSIEGNRANTEGARASVIEFTVQPVADLFSGALTDQVIHRYYGEGEHAAFDDIRPRDRSLQVRERSVYWQAKTLNEVREELELEPFEDEELGSKLFPLAIKGGGGGDPSAFSQMGRVGQFVAGSGEESDETDDDEETELDAKAVRDELRKWRGKARRELRDGRSAAYDWQSDVIPSVIKAQVLAGLETASTIEEVAASFDAGFCLAEAGPIPDWSSYP